MGWTGTLCPQPSPSSTALGSTVLGTWELELKTGFLAGSLTQQASNAQAVGRDDFEKTFKVNGCSTMDAPLDLGVKRSVRLILRGRGFDRF